MFAVPHAEINCVWVRFLAPLRSASFRMAPVRVAPRRSADESSEAVRSAPVSFADERSVLLRLVRVAAVPVKLAPVRMA